MFAGKFVGSDGKLAKYQLKGLFRLFPGYLSILKEFENQKLQENYKLAVQYLSIK